MPTSAATPGQQQAGHLDILDQATTVPWQPKSACQLYSGVAFPKPLHIQWVWLRTAEDSVVGFIWRGGARGRADGGHGTCS